MISQFNRNKQKPSSEEGLQQTATFFFPNESVLIKSPPSLKQAGLRNQIKQADSNQSSKVNSPNEGQRCRPIKLASKKLPFQFSKESTLATSFQNLNTTPKKDLLVFKKPTSPYDEQEKLFAPKKVVLKKQGSKQNEETQNNPLQRDSSYFRKFVPKKVAPSNENPEQIFQNTKTADQVLQKKFEQQKQYCETKMRELQEKIKPQNETKIKTSVLEEKKTFNLVPETTSSQSNIKQLTRQPIQIINYKQYSTKQEDQITSQLVLPKIIFGNSDHTTKSQNVSLGILTLYNSQKYVYNPPELSNQYGFPFRKNFEADKAQDIRKGAKTAQETLREQPISSKRTDIGLTSQDSLTSFPSINSPPKGTVLGFGQKKSFLQRKPQAKIVSRLFSSKSDNN